MQLVVKQAEAFVKEVRFAQGPIYIGREIESHLCLPHDSVAREHAVICGADETEWFAEDLKTGKTFVNNRPIQRSPLHDGDVITVGDFTIEVQLTGRAASLGGLSAEEVARQIAARPPKNIIRLYDQSDSPDIRMPPRRYKDYLAATLALQRSAGEQDLLKTLLAVAVQQFNMLHAFIGLRRTPEGPFACQVGKRRTGQNVKLSEIIFGHFIEESVREKQYILIPILPEKQSYERIRSALIAPILCGGACFGIIYIDNSVEDSHYSLNDLDYLMLLAVQAGAKMRQCVPASETTQPAAPGADHDKAPLPSNT